MNWLSKQKLFATVLTLLCVLAAIRTSTSFGIVLPSSSHFRQTRQRQQQSQKREQQHQLPSSLRQKQQHKQIQQQEQSSLSSSTALSATNRRTFFGVLRKAFVGAGGLVTSTITWNNTKNSARGSALPIGNAENASSQTKGRMVDLVVSNQHGGGKSGIVRIQLRPEWAPRGVQRFEQLTESNFFDGCRIFRVLPGFIAQFGIHGNPSVQAKWRSASIPDDPIKVSNSRGTIVFATAGPNTRTSQIFINTREQGNAFLDQQGFAPFGHVIDGMDIVDDMYSGYGEGPPDGSGPNQGLIQAKGNKYLDQYYPKLSFISKANFAS